MSEYTNTLAGLLLLNDQRAADIFPSSVLDEAPVVRQAYAQAASSGATYHKFNRRYTAATATFRKINSGASNTAEVIEEVTLNCEYLDGSFVRDVAAARAFRKGVQAYLQRETGAALKTSMYTIERAIFNFNIATQFVGLPYINDYADTDNTTHVVSAGGAGGKSVWLIRWGQDAVSLIAGNDGRVDMVVPADDQIVQVTDAGGTNKYMAYAVDMGLWIGLQVGSPYDVVRLCNLDGTSDDLLTDDLLSEALSLFPAGHEPNMIVMNRTARKELQQSRTATNPTGAPAPFPTEAFGVPIVVTDALGSAEATVNGSTTTTTTSSSI